MIKIVVEMGVYINIGKLVKVNNYCIHVRAVSCHCQFSGVIDKTVVQIASATGIGYQHDGSMRFSNKLTYALNC